MFLIYYLCDSPWQLCSWIMGRPRYTPDGNIHLPLTDKYVNCYIWWPIDDACIFTSEQLVFNTRVSISWLYPCNNSSYVRFVYSQYHVHCLKCTEQNVNNQNLTQVSQLYVHVSFCLKVIRSWHNLPIGGHGHVICMLVIANIWQIKFLLDICI